MVNAQLNGLFTLCLAAGYLWAAASPAERRGYVWVAGVMAKGLGAGLFVADHLLRGSPSSFLLFAATDGSLAVDVTDDNIYVLSGLADDFADGPDAVDHDQLDLAVELLRDIGDYSEEPTVDKALEPSRPLGKLVSHVLEPGSVTKPTPPYAAAVREWEKLEQFVDGRLRRE